MMDEDLAKMVTEMVEEPTWDGEMSNPVASYVEKVTKNVIVDLLEDDIEMSMVVGANVTGMMNANGTIRWHRKFNKNSQRYTVFKEKEPKTCKICLRSGKIMTWAEIAW